LSQNLRPFNCDLLHLILKSNAIAHNFYGNGMVAKKASSLKFGATEAAGDDKVEVVEFKFGEVGA